VSTLSAIVGASVAGGASVASTVAPQTQIAKPVFRLVASSVKDECAENDPASMSPPPAQKRKLSPDE